MALPTIVMSRRPSRPALVATLALALLLPSLAAAQFPAWQVPAGGETWTAGSSHTLAWSGGLAMVNGIIAYDVNSPAWYPVGANFPNIGNVVWNLPANLPPGTYYLQIAFNLLNPATTNSATFTVRAAPECLIACNLVTAGMTTADPVSGMPPAAYCGTSPHQAAAFAEAAVLGQLQAQCAPGYSVDPGSVVYDTTMLPGGVCFSGYSGGYLAESFAFGCCCPDAVPVESRSWGALKGSYR